MDSKAQILFSFLFFGLVAAMVFVRMNFILSKEENILSIIVMIVSMVTGLVAFLSGIKEMTSKSEHSVMEEAKSSENDFVDAEDYDTWQGDDTKDEQIDLNSYKSQISIGGKTRMAAPERASMGCGDETVVLDEGDEERAVTLYSRNADRTIRICLEKLPLTIGKLQGCVDSVIDDKSVSRIHCRFSQNEDGRIMLTDLNSTNGTFRNGLRLDPQKNTFIEEGDEVRIGRICFDCR